MKSLSILVLTVLCSFTPSSLFAQPNGNAIDPEPLVFNPHGKALSKSNPSRADSSLSVSKKAQIKRTRSSNNQTFEEIIPTPPKQDDDVSLPGTNQRGQLKALSAREFSRRNSKLSDTTLSSIVQPHVVGGSNAPGDYPWMVSILYSNISDVFVAHFCGGVLINPNFVLTAAHCVENKTASELQVIVGEKYLDQNINNKRKNVSEVLIYPYFDSVTLDNDLALLVLQSPVTDKEPIFIAESSDLNSTTGTPLPAQILGWGATNSARTVYPRYLQLGNTQIVSKATANTAQAWNGIITDQMIPAGYSNGSIVTCSGDSGGPLIVQTIKGESRLAGITSFGPAGGCSQANKYSIFTKVQSYSTWIYRQIAPYFSQWLALSNVTGLTLDQDNDGISNFEEYAFGSHPLVSNQRKKTTTTTVNDSGSLKLGIQFEKTKQNFEVRYTLESAPAISDSINWSPYNISSSNFLSPQNLGGSLEKATVFTEAFNSAEQKYFRLNQNPSFSFSFIPFIRDLLFGTTKSDSLSSRDYPLEATNGKFRKNYVLVGHIPGRSIVLDMISGAFDTKIELYNAVTGAFIDEDDDSGSGTNSQLLFRPEQGISYLIRATSFSSNKTGNFTLTTSTLNQPENLSAGSTLIRTLDPILDDKDPIKLAQNQNFYIDDYLLTGLVSGNAYSIAVKNAQFAPKIQILNASNYQVVSTSSNPNNSNGTSTLFYPQLGTSYIARVSTVSQSASGGYTISSSFAPSIAPFNTANGSLSSDDDVNPLRTSRYKDDYVLTGFLTGERITVRMTASFDAYLQLVNAVDGSLITYDDDSGGGGGASAFTFTVQAGITYIIRATSFSSSATGTYTLDVTSDTTEIFPNDEFINVPLNSSDKTISSRYVDDYFVSGAFTGETLSVHMNATFTPYLYLIDADTGTVISENSSDITFTVQAGRRYIIRATSYYSYTSGTYSLLLSSHTFLISYLDSSLSESLSSATDAINPLRNGSYFDDYYLTDTITGETYTIDMTASFDTYLQLINADTGALITYNDDGGSGTNSRLQFTIEAGKHYIIRATSYSSGATGSYNIFLDYF